MSTVTITTEAATTTDSPVSVPRTYMSLAHKRYFEDEGIDPTLAQAFTVNNVEALPEELKFHMDKGAGILPGIVFEHVSIRGEVTHQLRPDAESDDWGKYLFPKGAFNGPFIHRTQAGLVGKVNDVVIVEGTKQFRAAITAATADGSIGYRLFMGIPGCHGGLKGGRQSHDWMTAIKDGATITILFDKDMTTNPMVWKAGDELRKYLAQYVTNAKIKIAELSGYAKDGLDDMLKVLPAERRPAVLGNIISTAVTKMPPRPRNVAAQRSQEAGTAVMDFANGVCTLPPVTMGNTTLPGRRILPAAVRIVRSYSEWNDLAENSKPTMRFDLEVITKAGDDLTTHHVNGLTTDELSKPRVWLDRLRGGIGANMTILQKDEEMLVAAIRAASTQEMVTVMERCGLIVDSFGTVRYMDTAGALGPDDKVTDLRARILEPTMTRFALPNPHEMTKEETAAAFRHIFNMWDICVVPTAFLLTTGQLISSIYGMLPKGIYGSLGDPGSGKTTIMEMPISLLGPRIQMANFEASPGAVGMLGAGCENIMVVVDDFQDLSAGGKSAVENNNKGLNALARRGYGGAQYMRKRLGKNKNTDKWEVMETDPSSPFFSVTMERKAVPYGSTSSMQRLLLANVTKANSFATSDDAHKAMKMAKSPLGSMALSQMILHVLQTIAAQYPGANGLQEWKDQMEIERQATQEQLTFNYEGLLQDPRSYELPATPVFGIEMLLAFAHFEGIIDGDEYERRQEQSQRLIMEAAKDWQDSVTRRGGGVESTLSKMNDAVATGNYFIAENHQAAHVPADGIRVKILGWKHKYRGEDVVILVSTEAAKICRMDEKTLEAELLPYLVTDGAGAKKPLVPGPDGKKRRWALKQSAWDGLVGDYDAADHDEDPELSEF